MTTDPVTGKYQLLKETIQAANALVYQEIVYSGEMPRPAITAGFLPQKLPPHFRGSDTRRCRRICGLAFGALRN